MDENMRSRNNIAQQAKSGPTSKSFLLSSKYKPGQSYDFDAIKRRRHEMLKNMQANPMSGTHSQSTADYQSNIDGEVISLTALKRRQIN